jgi:hypothetical protein
VVKSLRTDADTSKSQKSSEIEKPVLDVNKLVGNSHDDQYLESVVLADFGETPVTVDSKLAQSASIAAYLAKLREERQGRIHPLVTESAECSKKLSALNERHQQLRKQLEAVELEITAITARQSVLEQSSAEVTAVYERQLSSLGVSHQQVVTATRLQDGTKALVAKIKDLEQVLVKAVVPGDGQEPAGKGASSSDASKPQPVDYPHRLGQSSKAFADYVDSEGQCTAILAQRIKLVKNQLAHQQEEVLAYKALSMQVRAKLPYHHTFANVNRKKLYIYINEAMRVS